MPQSDQSQSESTTEGTTVAPIPPRYWWLKRMGVVAGILFVALFALRLWWGWEANRRLQAEIDKIIAAGEPIYPEDFDPKEDIPDDQNAARLLIEAGESISLTSEQQELLADVGKPGLIKERFEEVREIVETGGAEALKLLRRARPLPSVDWGTRIRTPALNALLPNFSGQRNLAKLTCLAAGYHHIAGNDNEAVEILRDAFAQSKKLNQHPTLIAHLVAIACEANAIQTMEEILPKLRIASGQAAAAGGMATRSQIGAVMLELLDERPMREGMRLAMLSERMSQVDIVQGLEKGSLGVSSARGGVTPPTSTPWATAWNYLITPLVQLDGAAMIHDSSLRLKAAAESDWVRAKRVLPKEPEFDAVGKIVHFLSHILVPSLDRAFSLHFASLSNRRMAGTALAIRLYQADHGFRPQTLADLVPEYLSDIPLDPFAGDGSAIRYAPEPAAEILYSVGPDGADDGGKYAFRSSGAVAWDQLDMPFFLDGNRPTKPEDVRQATVPSIKAGENQKNADEDEGEDDEDESGEEEP